MKILITENQFNKLILNEQEVEIQPSDRDIADYIVIHKGAKGEVIRGVKSYQKRSGGNWTNCLSNSRKMYFKLKKQGKDVKYVEGIFYKPIRWTNLQTGEHFVDREKVPHAWNLINNVPYDFTYGENDGEYKGYVIKDEWMTAVPEWDTDGNLDYKKDGIDVLNHNLVKVNDTITT